jgi:hypothetical protein
MTTEFMPAAWLDAHGYSIDDVTVVLDQMDDEGAGKEHKALMLDCIDETMYVRASGVYQIFPNHVIMRIDTHIAGQLEEPQLNDLEIDPAHYLFEAVRGTRGSLYKAQPGVRRTPKHAGRVKHIDNALAHATACVGACLVAVKYMKDKRFKATVQALAMRLREGRHQIQKFREMLDVRARHGIHAKRYVDDQAEQEKEAAALVSLAQQLNDLGVSAEDVEAIYQDAETGDPGA